MHVLFLSGKLNLQFSCIISEFTLQKSTVNINLGTWLTFRKDRYSTTLLIELYFLT